MTSIRFESLFDVRSETDIRGRIISVNERFLEISKFSREELLGKDHRLLNSNFHPKSFFREMWGTIAQGKMWTGSIRNRAKDGSLFWIQMMIFPVVDSEGQIQKYVAFQRDVTNENENLDGIRRAESRYREVLNSVKVVVVGLNVSGEVRFCNTAGAVLFSALSLKAQPGSILGKDWFAEVLPPDQVDEPLRAFSDTLSSLKTSSLYRVKIQDANGTMRTLQLVNTPYVDDRGELEGVTVIGEDVTEILAQEQQIAALQEAAQKRREELIGFISHELKSPVTSIMVGLEMLSHHLKGVNSPVGMSPMEVVSRMKLCTEKILRISKDFMEVSVNGSGKMNCSFQQTNIQDVLDRVCHGVSQQLALHPELRFERRGQGKYLGGNWDSDRLEQVLSNLLSNALKYSKPEGGVIELDVYSKGLQSVIVGIRDTGIGVPAEDLERIFDPFVRGKNVSSAKVEGFGLGLKISKDIVDAHGGKIWIESQVGRGTEVCVELPVKEKVATDDDHHVATARLTSFENLV